jgi:hypothetical protein
MSRLRVDRMAGWLAVSLVMVPAGAVAQPPAVQTPIELADRLRPGDDVFLTDRSGIQTRGRLLRISADQLSLVIDGDGAARTISAADIGRIEKSDGLWNGMLLGAVPAALVGMAGGGASCSPNCARDVAIAAVATGAAGAVIGAFVDARVRGYSRVAGPPLPSPSAWRTPPPVARLDDVWMRVRQGDGVAVVLTSGERVGGTFVKVSQGSLTLDVRGANIDVPSASIRRVMRSGNRHRSGMVWGGLLAGTLGLTASAACSGGACGNPAGVAASIGTAGALWGTAIGVLIPKRSLVYESSAPAVVRMAPVIEAGRVGFSFSAIF